MRKSPWALAIALTSLVFRAIGGGCNSIEVDIMRTTEFVNISAILWICQVVSSSIDGSLNASNLVSHFIAWIFFSIETFFGHKIKEANKNLEKGMTWFFGWKRISNCIDIGQTDGVKCKDCFCTTWSFNVCKTYKCFLFLGQTSPYLAQYILRHLLNNEGVSNQKSRQNQPQTSRHRTQGQQ